MKLIERETTREDGESNVIDDVKKLLTVKEAELYLKGQISMALIMYRKQLEKKTSCMRVYPEPGKESEEIPCIKLSRIFSLPVNQQWELFLDYMEQHPEKKTKILKQVFTLISQDSKELAS